METRIAEIADGIYRLSTFMPEVNAPAGLTFSEFLIRAEQPMLFHLGHKKMFPQIAEAGRAAVNDVTRVWAGQEDDFAIVVGLDDDTVLHERHMWRVGVDVAGRCGIAADVVASLRAIEELRPQGAFEGLWRNPHLNCRSHTDRERQKRNEDEQTKERLPHDALSIMVVGICSC